MNRGPAHRRAFSLVETALATAIVGGLMLAVIEGVGASVKAGRAAGDRQRAAMVASGLMDEAARLPYEEPGTSSPPIGLDDGEVIDKRTDFDDVDDYNGLEGTPTDPNGNVLSGAESWSWVCVVEYEDASGQAKDDTGLKKITVEVYGAGKLLAQLVRVRAHARDAAEVASAQSSTVPVYYDSSTVTGVK